MARWSSALSGRDETRGEGGPARAQLGSQQQWWEGEAEVETDLHDCFRLGGQGEQGVIEGDEGELARKAAAGRGREARGHLEGESGVQKQLKNRWGGGEESGCERGERSSTFA